MVARKLSLPVQGHGDAPDPEVDGVDTNRLERELEGGGMEPGSGLDLHTPFAYVVSLFLPPVTAEFSRAFFPLGV